MNRPLFKHIRDHSVLFVEMAKIRDNAAATLGLVGHEFHKTPKFIAPNGQRLNIEPERSVIAPSVHVLAGIKSLLSQHIPSLSHVPQSEIGYRYPTAALAGPDAPFIKRLRSEYFHRVDEDRSICRPVNLSFGIKSRGKEDNRQEYEVWLPKDDPTQDPTSLFIDKFGEDLPDDVRHFIQQPSQVYGWMGVKRAAFESLYTPSHLPDVTICVGFSVDAYNIGARPDLSFAPEVDSSIAVSNAELEWEVMGYYAKTGAQIEHDDIWAAINETLCVIGDTVEQLLGSQLIPSNESKTERILSTVLGMGITERDIEAMALQPIEFLQTESHRRVKAHDPSRTVNFLGRLNRLFYQPEHLLPPINEIHDLIG